MKFIAVASGPMVESERPYGLPKVWKPNNTQKPLEGGTCAGRQLIQDYVPRLKSMGFEGISAYVYHTFLEKGNFSYAGIQRIYLPHWQNGGKNLKMIRISNTKFQLQWLGITDLHAALGHSRLAFPATLAKDNIISSKKTFAKMLKEAKTVSEKYRSSNANTVMICCWNEYLGGNYIEPTEGHGFDYLEAIRDNF